MTILIWLALGLTLLAFGGEAMVRGASGLAARLGISPLVIGLTVVAFATSAPEMAVSVHAGLTGQPDIALGNVLGSNILNILFILGACALLLPLVIATRLVHHDVPIMIGASVLVFALGFDGRVGRLDGLLLFLLLIGYVLFTIHYSRKETRDIRAVYESEYSAPPTSGKTDFLVPALVVTTGLVMLVLGGTMARLECIGGRAGNWGQ